MKKNVIDSIKIKSSIDTFLIGDFFWNVTITKHTRSSFLFLFSFLFFSYFSIHFISDDLDSFEGDKDGCNLEQIFDHFVCAGLTSLFLPLWVIHHVHFAYE